MKTQEIEDEVSNIREMLDDGFYPEEYLKFTRKLEEHLTKIEDSASSIMREHADMMKNGFTLDLYSEDFVEDSIWTDIKNVLNLDHGQHIELKVLRAEVKDDDN